MFAVPTWERVAVSIGVFLVLALEWRLQSLFFTLSDLVFALTLFALLCSHGPPLRPFGSLTGPWVIAFGLLSAGLLASSLVNGDPVRALIVIAQYGFALIGLPMLLGGRDEATTIGYAKCLVASILFVNLFGIVFYYTAYDPGMAREQYRYVSGSGRLVGLVGEPNGNAAMLALGLPFILYLWMSGRLSALLAMPAIGVSIVGVILSSSVNGLAMSVLSSTVFLLASGSFRVLAKAVAAVVVCMVVLFGWSGFQIPEVFQDRVLSAFESGDIEQAGTYEERMELIEEALRRVRNTTLLGMGADQFREHSPSHLPVHNVYLLLWAEGGLVSLIGWLLLLSVPFACAVRTLATSGKRLVGALGLSVSVVFPLICFSSAHMYGRHWMVAVSLATSLMLLAPMRRPGWLTLQDPVGMAPESGPARGAVHGLPELAPPSPSPAALTRR